jgi:hypothetical protein
LFLRPDVPLEQRSELEDLIERGEEFHDTMCEALERFV